MNLMILSTAPESYATKCLVNAATKCGHKATVIDPVKLYLFISNKEVGYDRIYFRNKNKIGRINLKDFDAIIPRLGEHVSYGAFIVEHFNKNLGIPSIQCATGIRNATNKLLTLQICSSYGLATPRTVYLNNIQNLDYLIEKIGGYPIIVKLTQGSGGTGVALLKDRISAIPTIQSLVKSRSNVLIQEYIESLGRDYRVIVIGNKIVASYQRISERGDFRANLQQGGSGEAVTLCPADMEFCIKAARAIDLNIAGIDIIKNKGGKTYLLEVNANFGFKVQKITSINIANQIIQFIEQNFTEDNIENIIQASKHNSTPTKIKSQESLYNLISLMKRQLSFYTQNNYMQELYQKLKGKRIRYSDRSNKNRQVTIKSIQDLYIIVFDTFMIN